MEEADGVKPLSLPHAWHPSPSQARTYSDWLDSGGRRTFLTHAAYRVNGELNIRALERAVNLLGRRHEVLRAPYFVHGERLWQRVDEASSLHLRCVSVADDTELFELLIGDRDMGFDLHVAPLARVTFAKVNSTAALSVAVDNTVADGWSMRILLDELSAAYTQFAHNDTAPDLGPVLQYGTWLARRDSAASSRAPAVLRFWDDVLPDDPADISVNLPGAREVPSQSPHSTVVTSTRFHSSGFCLRNLASCYGTTPFVVALTSVAIVLRFESGRDVVTIATNHANRDLDTVNNVVGWLSDIILLRFDVVRPESFEHCVSMVQGVLRTSLTHTALPFLTIVSNKWKGAFTGLPARDCIYAALEGSWTELSLPAAQLAPYELPESEPDRPGLEIWIGDHYGILKVTAVCSATYYDIGYIEQLVEAVGELLLGLNSSPR